MTFNGSGVLNVKRLGNQMSKNILGTNKPIGLNMIANIFVKVTYDWGRLILARIKITYMYIT